LRALIERAAARKNLQLQILMEADSFRVLTSIVEEGIGFTLLPPSAVRTEVAEGRLEAAPITKPSITRELILASPADRPASVATTTISALIRSEIKSIAAEGLWDMRMDADAGANASA
jgi:DNA-binding transcriptional LysR family regulator